MPLVNRIGLTVIALALSLGEPVEADVVAVVSAKSPVTTLSKKQVADIFLGTTRRFPDGSQALPIDQSEETVVRHEFYTRFTGKSAAQIKAHWSKIIFTGRGQPPKTVANSIETKKLLAQYPNAVGYIEPNMVDSSVRVLLTQ